MPDFAIGGSLDAILHPLATMLPIDFGTTEGSWFFKLELDPGGFVARVGAPACFWVVVYGLPGVVAVACLGRLGGDFDKNRVGGRRAYFLAFTFYYFFFTGLAGISVMVLEPV